VPALRPGTARREAGFSFAEVIVALAVTVLLAVSILTVFDFNNRLSRVQIHIADMQESLRATQYQIVRQLRMAGRGGLPPNVAISVRNNVGLGGAQGNILVGVGSSPAIVRGTDVITMRGVVSTSVYQINYNDSSVFTAPNPAGEGSVLLTDPGPTGVRQDLTPFEAILNGASMVHDALVMVSPTGDSQYAVVEIDPSQSTVVINRDSAGNTVSGNAKLSFLWTNGIHTDAYKTLYNASAGFPLTRAAAVGILEEYRFYVRDVPVPAGSVGSASNPVLSMARVFPGSEEAYPCAPCSSAGADDNLHVDVADAIVDLQVALGIDTNGDGVITGAPTPTAADEWLYNDPADGLLVGTLKYVRVSTVARTLRPDSGYNAPPLSPLEDHDYDNPPNALNAVGGADRHYRRRVLQTLVDLRNVG